MKRYLLTIWQPEGPPPPDVDLDKVMADVDASAEETKTAGVWVFNGGLHPPDTATVLRPRGEELLVTDGPYLEGKEHVGGVLVIDAPDLDAARLQRERWCHDPLLPARRDVPGGVGRAGLALDGLGDGLRDLRVRLLASTGPAAPYCAEPPALSPPRFDQ